MMRDAASEAKAAKTGDTAFLCWMCAGFGLMFGVGGLIAVWFVLVEPFLRWQHAQSWKSVPCRIVHSEVQSYAKQNKSGVWIEMHSAHVRYAFEWQGAEREATTIGITGFQHQVSSDRSTWEAEVGRYPIGATMTCYVDSEDPTRSALDRSFPAWDILVGAILSGVFLGSGLLFLVIAWKIG